MKKRLKRNGDVPHIMWVYLSKLEENGCLLQENWGAEDFFEADALLMQLEYEMQERKFSVWKCCVDIMKELKGLVDVTEWCRICGFLELELDYV